MTNMASFYGPMMTTVAFKKQCQLRFFYFIDDEPVKAAFTELRIFAWYASNLTHEPVAIRTLSIGIREDLQQRWNKAVVGFSSLEPFRFVFRGFLGSKQARLSVDDISYSSGCVQSSAKPITGSTTVQASQTTQTNKALFSTTPEPLKKRRPGHSGRGGIVAAILVPVLLIGGIALGYFGYRHYQMSRRTDENFSLSMKGIMSSSGNNN